MGYLTNISKSGIHILALFLIQFPHKVFILWWPLAGSWSSKSPTGVSLPLEPARDMKEVSRGVDNDAMATSGSGLSSPPRMLMGELALLLEELNSPPTRPITLGVLDPVGSESLKLDTRRILITFFISLMVALWEQPSPMDCFLLANELALLNTELPPFLGSAV